MFLLGPPGAIRGQLERPQNTSEPQGRHPQLVWGLGFRAFRVFEFRVEGLGFGLRV